MKIKIQFTISSPFKCLTKFLIKVVMKSTLSPRNIQVHRQRNVSALLASSGLQHNIFMTPVVYNWALQWVSMWLYIATPSVGGCLCMFEPPHADNGLYNIWLDTVYDHDPKISTTRFCARITEILWNTMHLRLVHFLFSPDPCNAINLKDTSCPWLKRSKTHHRTPVPANYELDVFSSLGSAAHVGCDCVNSFWKTETGG